MPLTVAAPAPILGWDRDAQRIELPGLGPTAIGLRGRHQAANAAVADAVLDALDVAGIATVAADARRRGYADARWAGRLELLAVPGAGGGGTRDVLLDGAHNPDGAAALAQALDDLAPYLAGGQAEPAASRPSSCGRRWPTRTSPPSSRRSPGPGRSARATVVCTAVDAPVPSPPRTLPPPGARRCRTCACSSRTDPDAALDLALATGDGPVVVAGSLYLVGAARARLVDDPLLRDPVAA